MESRPDSSLGSQVLCFLPVRLCRRLNEEYTLDCEFVLSHSHQKKTVEDVLIQGNRNEQVGHILFEKYQVVLLEWLLVNSVLM